MDIGNQPFLTRTAEKASLESPHPGIMTIRPRQFQLPLYQVLLTLAPTNSRGQEHVKKLKAAVFRGIENVSRP